LEDDFISATDEAQIAERGIMRVAAERKPELLMLSFSVQVQLGRSFEAAVPDHHGTCWL
jgi:hypothetical protein